MQTIRRVEFEGQSVAQLQHMLATLDHHRCRVEDELHRRGERSAVQLRYSKHEPSWSALLVTFLTLLCAVRFLWLGHVFAALFVRTPGVRRALAPMVRSDQVGAHVARTAMVRVRQARGN